MASGPAPALSASLLVRHFPAARQACAIPRSTRLTTSAVSAGNWTCMGWQPAP